MTRFRVWALRVSIPLAVVAAARWDTGWEMAGVAFAQQGSLLNQRPNGNDVLTSPPPPRNIRPPVATAVPQTATPAQPGASPGYFMPGPPQPENPGQAASPDPAAATGAGPAGDQAAPGTVSATPLPPPDPAATPSDLVPNPLGDPAAKPASGGGRPAQDAGQVQKGTWVQMGTATLQALDKVNARVETLAVKVGDITHFGSLDIGVRGCFIRPPDRPADATAFLVVRDRHNADSLGFSGWMVRSAPYMSMMANPIYDIRVTGCAP